MIVGAVEVALSKTYSFIHFTCRLKRKSNFNTGESQNFSRFFCISGKSSASKCFICFSDGALNSWQSLLVNLIPVIGFIILCYVAKSDTQV